MRPGSPLDLVIRQCGGQHVEPQLHMALCGAARCTSAQQRSALHAAADEGRLQDLQVCVCSVAAVLNQPACWGPK